MIILNQNDPIPENALYIATIDGVTHIYEETDPEYIALRANEARQRKHIEIHEAHRAAIKNGLDSSATGQSLNYSLDTEDMLDMSNRIALGSDAKFRAGQGKRFVAHTLSQLKQVRDELTTYKFEIYEKLENRLDQIEAAQTAAEVEVVMWMNQ